MKRSSLLVFVFSILSISVFAQEPTDKKPVIDDQPTPEYKLHTGLPAFNILLLDSTTMFNTYNIPKGKPVVIMNFMPDCDHCQKLAEKLLKGMDTLKNIRFYLVSPMELKDIRRFSEKFDLAKYPNVVIGKDKDYFGPGFYQIKFVPFLALYDKNKQLIRSFEQTVEVRELEAASKLKAPVILK